MILVEEMTEETRNFLDFFDQSPVEEELRAVEPETAPAKLARVPKVLRDDESIKECFEPKFVSIGPYHHGNPKLQEAEKLKKKLAKQFILACSCTAETLYKKLYNEINQIRDFYENEVKDKYNDEALTRILFVDGCFLLYFIYRFSQNALEENHTGISVQWDLCLLENQLPFLVLKLLGENSFEKWHGLIVWFIEFICSSFLPIEERWKRYNLQPENSSHLVQLLQIGLRGSYEIKRDGKYLLSPPPNYSVTVLKKVWIHCKPSPRGGFKCTRFSPYWMRGVLELPSMAIGLFTRTNLLNLIAYEMHPDVHDSEIQSYIFFLASLVRQPQDVEALREARILYNYIGSDEEVVELFKEISAKSSPEKILAYHEIQMQIGSFLDKTGRTEIATREARILYNNIGSDEEVVELFKEISAKSSPEKIIAHDEIQMQIGSYLDKRGRTKIATWLAEAFSIYFRSPWTTTAVLAGFLGLSAAIIQLVLKIVSDKNKN